MKKSILAVIVVSAMLAGCAVKTVQKDAVVIAKRYEPAHQKVMSNAFGWGGRVNASPYVKYIPDQFILTLRSGNETTESSVGYNQYNAIKVGEVITLETQESVWLNSEKK